MGGVTNGGEMGLRVMYGANGYVRDVLCFALSRVARNLASATLASHSLFRQVE